MLISTQLRETHETFVTVSVEINNLDNAQFFIVHVDRITNEASVFHQGRMIRTTHDLAETAGTDDCQAFAILAVLSLAFNIKG